MKNKSLVIIAIVVVTIVVGLIFVFGNRKEESMFKTTQDIITMMEKIKESDKLPSLETRKIDVEDKDLVESYTGIKSIGLISDVVVNEPLMGSQAYSVVAVKVKNISDVEKIKKEIYDNINMRKWICVTAEKLLITNVNDLVFVVMTDKDWFDVSYNLFKEYVKDGIGKELTKEENE